LHHFAPLRDVGSIVAKWRQRKPRRYWMMQRRRGFFGIGTNFAY
jgi:hypothetical protein